MHNVLIDSFGRVAKKLRISVTDRCNMRCIYCMPADVKWLPTTELLSYDELVRLAGVLAGLGIEKIRVTGGEPLLRPGIEDLINKLSALKKIKSISMTTNGLLLGEKLKHLKDAGLQSVNISLDTFQDEKFKSMGGVRGADRVLAAIHSAIDLGLKVKINTVVIRGWNDFEVTDFVEFARETGCTVRFIEFMPLDGSGIWRPELVVSKKEMLSTISRAGTDLVPLDMDGHENSEPARYYSFAEDKAKGGIGFIASMTEPFCGNCDRIRITSEGKFLTCLFENPGYDIKELLQNGKSDQEIAGYLVDWIKRKPEGIVSIIKANQLKPKLNLMHRIGG